MSPSPPLCRLCGSAQVQELGTIPDGDFFAGKVLQASIEGGRLWRCGSCELMFRAPVLPLSRYRQLYENGAAAQWSGDERRLDLREIILILKSHAGLSVLDIGCGTGELLAALPAGWHRFGVEPAAGAARNATARGIAIIAPSIEDLPVSAKYDAVTMVDLVEHVLEPGKLLDLAYSHLLPGGMMIVSTGDPNATVWRRIFRSRFWYCSFPEHISFPSGRFFQLWCERNGHAPLARRTIRYRASKPLRNLLNLIMQSAYLVSPSVFNLVGRAGQRLLGVRPPYRRQFSPAIGGLFADHQIVTITRPSDP